MKLLISILVLSIFSISTLAVYAGEVPKTLPSVTKQSSSVLGVSTKFSKDKQTLIATFSNIKDIKSLSYTLMYEANGIPEGVVGSIKASTKPVTRNIYLGTCSGKVCKPHKKIKKMSLQLKGEYKNKKKINQTLKINI